MQEEQVYIIEYKFKGEDTPHFKKFYLNINAYVFLSDLIEKYKDNEEKPLEYAYWNDELTDEDYREIPKEWLGEDFLVE